MYANAIDVGVKIDYGDKSVSGTIKQNLNGHGQSVFCDLPAQSARQGQEQPNAKAERTQEYVRPIKCLMVEAINFRKGLETTQTRTCTRL